MQYGDGSTGRPMGKSPAAVSAGSRDGMGSSRYRGETCRRPTTADRVAGSIPDDRGIEVIDVIEAIDRCRTYRSSH
ncbi:hypothetical protein CHINAEXTREME_19050 [Halobiforma lacisalsi AJ5]|uniref:Uncharacterized protein n=2 Tax=Natronobacterium lacisalsi TaxID=229731 RepID=M0LSG9_NATLA|nr:hypothetical protein CHINAEXTREME_19050 [Halobiforma lacisalsi AJ5]EMA36088.1 hypothetical protein C445_04503 [Halobiforma lacisalsi AJ5]